MLVYNEIADDDVKWDLELIVHMPCKDIILLYKTQRTLTAEQ